MALPDFTITHTVRDSEGNLSDVQHYFTGVYDDAVTYAGQLTNSLNILTDGVIARVTLSETLASDSALPAGNVDNEIKGQFTFLNSDGLTMRVSVPSFNRALLIPNSDQIDPEGVGYLAYTGNVVSTAGAVDSRAIDLTGVKSALEAYGRRQK